MRAMSCLATQFICLLSFAVACKNPGGQGNNSDVKEIDFVQKRVAMTQGNLPNGNVVGVIRCAPGWVDSSTGQSEFTVPFVTIKNTTFGELEATFCTQRLDQVDRPGPERPGNGAVVKLGFYHMQSGSGCADVHITPKTLNGRLKSLTVVCLDNRQSEDLDCRNSGACTNDRLALRYFDEGLIEIKRGDQTAAYQFRGDSDVCLANGGKHSLGVCWVLAARGSSCNSTCSAANMTFDSQGAEKDFQCTTAELFNLPRASFTDNEPFLGCSFCEGCTQLFFGVEQTGKLAPDRSHPNHRPICACK